MRNIYFPVIDLIIKKHYNKDVYTIVKGAVRL